MTSPEDNNVSPLSSEKPSATLSAVLDAISNKRYRYANEIDLHEGLSAALSSAEIDHEREVMVAGGRIDFVVDRLGVEVKVKGSVTALEQQVARYCADGRLDEFLVITTRPAHGALPSVVRDKPVWVHRVGGLSL